MDNNVVPVAVWMLSVDLAAVYKPVLLCFYVVIDSSGDIPQSRYKTKALVTLYSNLYHWALNFILESFEKPLKQSVIA